MDTALHCVEHILQIIRKSGIGTARLGALLDCGLLDDLLTTPDPASVDRKMLREVLINDFVMSCDTYELKVDRGLSFDDMLGAGEYSVINRLITEQSFPCTAGGVEQVSIQVVCFGRPMTNGEIKSYFSRHSLQPADLPVLCALGATHPALQRGDHAMVALGSPWNSVREGEVFPILDEIGGDRVLRLSRSGIGKWSEEMLFVAVSA